MLKPASLQAALVASVPELGQHKDKLSLYVDKGQIQSALGRRLSWTYAYTLEVYVTDLLTHPDAVFAVALHWVRANQVELLQNPEKRDTGLTFACEPLQKGGFDLLITLSLTEDVCVTPGTDPTAADALTRYTLTHQAEPDLPGIALEPERWLVYDNAGNLLATLDSPPSYET